MKRLLLILVAFFFPFLLIYAQEKPLDLKQPSEQNLIDSQHNNNIEPVKNYNHPHLDKTRSTIDSLRQLPAQSIQHIDSLQQSLVDGFQSKLDSLGGISSGLCDSLSQLQNTVYDSLQSVTDQLNKIPTTGLSSNPLTGNDFPEGLLEKNLIPDTNIAPSDLPAVTPVGNLDLDGVVDQNLPDIGGLENPVEGLPEIEEIPSGNVDQVIDSKAGDLDAFKSLNTESAEGMGQLEELKEIPSDLQQYGDIDQMKSAAQSKAQEETIKKMNELFNEHSDKLEEANNVMSKLKKKYSYVPNSNDLSTARKASSLEGEPLKKRISVGGNFKFERGNPLTLDIAPLIMYKINLSFYAGLSASYRATLKYNDQTLTTNAEDVFGGSGLIRHKVFKGFFAYSEFEYRSAPVTYQGQLSTETIIKRDWVPGMLVGMGKELALKGKLRGTIILTYDFLHSDKSFNNSPWNIKFGFALDDLDLKNRKKELANSFMESIGK